MKKVIALFLLFMMTLVAVQPTLALHFCGGRLKSVAIGSIQKPCCGEASENPIKTRNAENRLQQPINTCCSSSLIELSTDNYPPSEQQSIIDFQQQTFYPALFLYNFPLKGSYLNNSLINKYFCPPGGLARYSVDLLTVICIFRI
jgi:hypothetical protein